MPYPYLTIRNIVLPLLVVFSFSAVAHGFDPQPEPPGRWLIEGFVDLTINEVVETIPGRLPFGLTREVLDPGRQPAFTISLRGTFAADGERQPVAGSHLGTFRNFSLEIGDAGWSVEDTARLGFEIMPNNPHVYVTGAAKNGQGQEIVLILPEGNASGRWRAHDQGAEGDFGIVFGTYSLRSGIVPEPTSFAQVPIAFALILFVTRRGPLGPRVFLR